VKNLFEYPFWYNRAMSLTGKPLNWMGSSKKDLMALPVGVPRPASGSSSVPF
jgi:hypothetical protein